jgi:pentose-5-phosphate-3-epimerase
LATVIWLKKKFPHLTIVVDGGVEPGNVGLIQQAGAEGVVSGSYLFAASEPMKAYQALKKSSVKKK